MRDLNNVINKLMQSSVASGFAGGLAGGVAGSLLTGKSGRKLAKKTLEYGGMAAVAALAYTAYQRYAGGRRGADPVGAPTPGHALLPAPEGSAFLPARTDTVGQESLGLALVRAMIAAARADGKLDAEESQAVFQRIQSSSLDAEEKALLIDEMNHAADMDAIVRAGSTPEAAAELYTASLLAIRVDHPAENAYLSMLAARLKLPSTLVTELHREVSAA